jgi:hypothetical protein
MSTAATRSCCAARQAELRNLPNVSEVSFQRLREDAVSDPDWDVGVYDVLAFPYYESAGFGYGFESDVVLSYDRVPKGEVELRRASNVLTADGEYVGDVDGFLVAGDDITHFVSSAVTCGVGGK